MLKDYIARKGHWCIAFEKAHDMYEDGFVLRRVIKASRTGLISHIATNQDFNYGHTAVSTNSLDGWFYSFANVEEHGASGRVWTLGEHATKDFSALDGIRWGNFADAKKDIINHVNNIPKQLEEMPLL